MEKYVEEALDVKYNVRILYNPIISVFLVGTNYEKEKYISCFCLSVLLIKGKDITI